VKLLSLILLVSLSAIAQEREVDEVQDGTIRTPKGDIIDIHGGAYLPMSSLISLAQETAALRAENKVLKETPASPPALVAVRVGALVLGCAGAYVFGRLSR
jgi:hypothetical protein